MTTAQGVVASCRVKMQPAKRTPASWWSATQEPTIHSGIPKMCKSAHTFLLLFFPPDPASAPSCVDACGGGFPCSRFALQQNMPRPMPLPTIPCLRPQPVLVLEQGTVANHLFELCLASRVRGSWDFFPMKKHPRYPSVWSPFCWK
jgi:hypothetical protein